MSANEFARLADGEERDFSEQRPHCELGDYNQEGACKGSLPAVETGRIRILYVYENPLLLQGIRAIFEAEPDMQLLAWAASIEDGIRKYLEHKPDVTLLDYGLPAANGFDALGALLDKFPDARLILHTTKSGDVRATRVLKAGVFGYIPERTLCRDLVDAIRTVYRGQKYIPPEVADDLARYVLEDALTSRELEILGQLAIGSTNKLIAGRLGITEDTVKAHMKSILSKLSANDRAHAVVIAIRRGFIDL